MYFALPLPTQSFQSVSLKKINHHFASVGGSIIPLQRLMKEDGQRGDYIPYSEIEIEIIPDPLLDPLAQKKGNVCDSFSFLFFFIKVEEVWARLPQRSA